MTKNEFMEKYKDVEFTFSRYYKYTFTFEGVTEDGKTIILSCGGDTNEIYRYEVRAGVPENIHCLEPNDIEVYKGGKLIESLYS